MPLPNDYQACHVPTSPNCNYHANCRTSIIALNNWQSVHKLIFKFAHLRGNFQNRYKKSRTLYLDFVLGESSTCWCVFTQHHSKLRQETSTQLMCVLLVILILANFSDFYTQKHSQVCCFHCETTEILVHQMQNIPPTSMKALHNIFYWVLITPFVVYYALYIFRSRLRILDN